LFHYCVCSHHSQGDVESVVLATSERQEPWEFASLVSKVPPGVVVRLPAGLAPGVANAAALGWALGEAEVFLSTTYSLIFVTNIFS